MKTHLVLAAAALSLFATACTGGNAPGGSSAVLPVPPVPVVTAAPVATYARKLIILGDTGSGGRVTASRSAKFVSPSTNSSQIVVTLHSTATVVYTSVSDLSNGSPNCTGSGASRVCTIPLQLPAGNLDFALKTYDLAPVAGAIPGTAKQLAQSVLTQAIVPNAPNSVVFMLSGIVVGAPPVNGGTTYASVPADGALHTFAFSVAAADADANVITGSIPFLTPVPVTLTESGGSGHARLVLNGTNVGASASLTKATDTLALAYDGLSVAGYSTVTTIGGTPFRVSALTIAPTSTTITTLTASRSFAITEASAPGTVAYAATPTGCGGFISGSTVTGSGAAASEGFNSTVPGGTNTTCSIVLTDNLGSSVPYAITYVTGGPITAPGVVTFPTGPASGGGSCNTSIAFNAVSQTAVFTLNDPGFAGVFTTANTTPATATVSVSGTTATITAVAAGATTITFGDSFGNTFACPVGVTTASGSVS